MSDALPPLPAAEARVLGVLIEKEKTTPDVYPLTVNALLSGCNQKTSRDPVMSLTESEVQAALESLRQRNLVVDSYGASGRVLRYAQNFRKVYGVPAAAMALLATLMLRGPQTASELRANADRLHVFADLSTVEAYLDELATRTAAPLVRLMPRQPGTREPRWAHLLSGEPELLAAAPVVPASGGGSADRLAVLAARVDALEAALKAIQSRLDESTASH